MRITRLISIVLGSAALCLASVDAEAANARLALVIGESIYADAALPTTANDAGLIAQVLQAAGFDVIGARDLDQKGLRQALRDFLDRVEQAGPDAQGFLYFSGRALQYEGDNYLVPIDARIARDADAPIEAVKLSDYTHALAAASGIARIVVIDGARSNPYAQQGSPLAGGLALVDPEPGSLIAFNAAPGAVGVQDAGDYGVYAKTLAGLMRQGGVDVAEVLSQTRVAVNQATQGAQIPWSAGKLKEPYYLFERAADAPPPKRLAISKKPLKQLSAQEAYGVVIERDSLTGYQEYVRDFPRSDESRRIAAILAARREALFWRRAVRANTPRAYWTYLARYPQGPHSYDADRRLAALAARREPPPDFEVIEYEDLPPPPQAESADADRPYYYFGGDDYGPPPPPPPPGFVENDEDSDWRDLPPPPPPATAGVLPTLAVAIPLLLAARAYHERPSRNGVAPASAPPPAPRAPAPPPLPRGVVVNAVPTPVPTRAAPAGPGRVKFAAPTPGPQPTPDAARSPSPKAPATATPAASPTPTLRPALTPLPTPGAPATPTPSPTSGPRPALTPLPTPSPSPTATPEAAPTPQRTLRPTPTPLPTPGATPLPNPPPSASRTPHATPEAAPTPQRTLRPTPTPLPTPGATPLPNPSPSATRTPRANPEAAPTPERTLRPTPVPLPTPGVTSLPSPSPSATRTPRANPEAAPTSERTRTPEVKQKREAPREESPREKPPRAEPTREPPKPAPQLRVEPPPRREPQAERVEPPKPAPQPRVEPLPRAERVEPPKPAPQLRVEPPKAPAPAGRSACGHPGEPKC